MFVTSQKPAAVQQQETPSTKLEFTRQYCYFLLERFPDFKAFEGNFFSLKEKVDLYLNKNVPVEKVSEVFKQAIQTSPSLIPMLIEGRGNPDNWRYYAILLALEHSSETAELLMPSFLATLNNFRERDLEIIIRKAVQHSSQFVAPLLEKGIKANTRVLNVAAEYSPHLIPMLLENGAIPQLKTLYILTKYENNDHEDQITKLLIQQGFTIEETEEAVIEGMINIEKTTEQEIIDQEFQRNV